MTTPHNEVSRTDDTSPSAGWETVYDRFDVPTTAHDDSLPEIVTDGGCRYVLPDTGVRVIDGDTGAELVVVAVRPDTRADECHDADGLVSAANPDHPPWAPVVEVVDAATVDGWQSVNGLRDHADVFSVPVTRLETASGHGGETA
jgi:hypothetical protein